MPMGAYRETIGVIDVTDDLHMLHVVGVKLFCRHPFERAEFCSWLQDSCNLCINVLQLHTQMRISR